MGGKKFYRPKELFREKVGLKECFFRRIFERIVFKTIFNF
jgi:hypothetical protein